MTRSFFSGNSYPFNISVAEWTTLWWKWLKSIPRRQNPATDKSGKFCATNQRYSEVWFLAGTYGGCVTRTCIIPCGKCILFPIIASLFSFATDPHLKTEKDLLRTVENDINMIERLSLTIDGVNFEDFREFRVRSEVFRVMVNGKVTKAVSDGYWVFMKPPPIGIHNIHFLGKNADFFNEVYYTISIT
jgi:hypothetical protein